MNWDMILNTVERIFPYVRYIMDGYQVRQKSERRMVLAMKQRAHRAYLGANAEALSTTECLG